MFLFTKKSFGTFYKPNIENIMSSNSYVNPNTNIVKITNSPVSWTRTFFDKSQDTDYYFYNSYYQGTLDSYLSKNKNKKNEHLVVELCKNIYYLGYFFNKWLSNQIRSTGFLNLFHPWFVIRHRYFYRGY
jgi:hypothetical protein